MSSAEGERPRRLVPRWVPRVFTMELRRMMAYRADFWLNFLANIVFHLAAAYFLWRAVFDSRGVERMAGYSFAGLMLYYLMVPLVDRMVRGPEFSSNIAREIYDGSLNRYIVYPVSFFGYKYTAGLALLLANLIQFLAALGFFLLVFGLPADVTPGLQGFAMGLAMILLAGLMYFLLSACLEMVAFWADNVWSLQVLLRFVVYLAGGGMIPLAFFPEWARELIAYTPFPYLMSFPIRCFLGTATPAEFMRASMVVGGWIPVFALTARLVWKRGALRYTGVGI